MPTVSVVIPCFNYGEHLEEAIMSVLGQTYRDLEIIVVNDGSSDDSLAVAERLAAQHAQLTVIDQPNSGQPAIARNNGIARARGRYVLCLDADDMIGASMLDECVALLESDPGLGVVYPWQQNFGANQDGPLASGWDAERLRYGNRLPVASLFRREAWEAVGGYSTNVPGYEDWDFWIGCAAQGWRGVLARRAVFLYRVHEEGLYTDAVGRDLKLKAQIVLNRAGLYGPAELAWARGVLADDPVALAIPTRLGIIPQLERPQLPEVRAFTAVAFGEELISDPGLLAAYGREFRADDDATLVIVAPGERDELIEAVAAANVDGDGSADLLAVAQPVAGVDALYSRRPAQGDLAGLPRFDDSSVSDLRRLMERRSGLAA